MFYSSTFNNTDIVLVFSRWGKTAAASTVTTLINVFHVDFVLFTGVAGAVDPRLAIGDIVIGQSLYHHEMDARPFFQRFETPLTGTTYFKPANTDIQTAEKSVQDFVNNIKST
jgi:adenosylhomocysteine nucleosidase